MKFYTSSQLTKYIFSIVDETDIFAYYLNVPITEIYKAINNKNYRVKNNLRSEDNASFGLQYYSIGGKVKLYGKDWASPAYTGDCLHLVGMALGLNCNIGRDFVEICKDIIKRLIDNDYSRLASKPSKPKEVAQKEIIAIDIKHRDYNNNDIKYWASYGIKPETISREKIFAIDSFYIDNEIQDYFYEVSNPAYAYYLGNNPKKLWEIYRPNELKYFKFRTNNYADLKELYTISKNKNLIVTKSKKDKALIGQILRELGIYETSVLYTSESSRFKKHTRVLIDSNYRDIYINFDLDTAGMESMKYFNKEYKYSIFPFTDDKIFYKIKDHPKDITDFCKRFGYDNTLKVFDYLYNKYIN